ncbi:Histone-lysine N-methyltransferase ashr3 [Orobanche hederae]
MPSLHNVLNSPADFSSCLDFKPIIREAQLDPKLYPNVIRDPDPVGFQLGPRLKESYSCDDDELGKFRSYGGGETGKSKELESDPEKLPSEASDEGGDGNERALNACRVIEPTTAELGQECSQRKIEEGVPKFKCSLPFLVGAPKLVVCRVCQNAVYPDERILCSVRGCQGVLHLTCAKESMKFSSIKQFKCPQHACFLCNQKNHLWRCIRCPIACHDKCAPFPGHVIKYPDRPGEAICWRHPADWHQEKHEVPARNLEDVFSLLPLPYHVEEFKIDLNWQQTETKLETHPYIHIKRNVYLVKRKRSNVDADIGCTSCSSTQCSDGCVCRFLCISCSKACRCSKNCKNRPFQKVKKIQIVKTERCGWGVVAAESISKGDFVVEYVGEVIDDAMCERRLWDMKDQDAKNFYMCEINKDFVIDATFKGNASRFLNHSCAPNCKLEKWQVEGEVRVGVFASRSIKAGEALTYDYRDLCNSGTRLNVVVELKAAMAILEPKGRLCFL